MRRWLVVVVLGIAACARTAGPLAGPTPTPNESSESEVAVGFAAAWLANDLEAADAFMCPGNPPVHRQPLSDARVIGPPEKGDRIEGVEVKDPEADLYVPFEATHRELPVEGQVGVTFGQAPGRVCVDLFGFELDVRL